MFDIHKTILILALTMNAGAAALELTVGVHAVFPTINAPALWIGTAGISLLLIMNSHRDSFFGVIEKECTDAIYRFFLTALAIDVVLLILNSVWVNEMSGDVMQAVIQTSTMFAQMGLAVYAAITSYHAIVSFLRVRSGSRAS